MHNNNNTESAQIIETDTAISENIEKLKQEFLENQLINKKISSLAHLGLTSSPMSKFIHQFYLARKTIQPNPTIIGGKELLLLLKQLSKTGGIGKGRK